MASIIVQIFLYTFFIYGVSSFVGQIVSRVHKSSRKIPVDSILFVKDQEDTIELDINNILSRIYGRLIVIDRGSTDDTLRILKKMEFANENMTVVTVGDSVQLGG
ncbi:MAG: hypothetical protein J6Y29_01665 [Clostridiales bacterium]|nr:hypothetical protein [Clostridiales bacterium]